MLLEQFRAVENQIGRAEDWITSFMQNSALCQRLATIPGVGAITATAIVAAVGDAKAFKNGRHLAAWIGLVPRQNSSGGKNRLLGISKRGDGYLRTLLIHGARSVLIRVACKSDARSRWLQELIARRGTTVPRLRWQTRTHGSFKRCCVTRPATAPRWMRRSCDRVQKYKKGEHPHWFAKPLKRDDTTG